MPRKIKIVNESIEKTPPSSPVSVPETVDVVQDTPNPILDVKVPKEKKPRTEKQILAFQKALEKRKEKLEAKKLETPKVEEVQELKEIPKVAEVKKRGRPSLSQEKIEMKASLKEIALQKQVEKLQKKIEMSAKKEAKKVVLNKIKSKLDNDEDSETSLSDDEEIEALVKKQKKPIVILNKIDNGKAKKVPPSNIPSAFFV
jgi:hypothetical protein